MLCIKCKTNEAYNGSPDVKGFRQGAYKYCLWCIDENNLPGPRRNIAIVEGLGVYGDQNIGARISGGFHFNHNGHKVPAKDY